MEEISVFLNVLGLPLYKILQYKYNKIKIPHLHSHGQFHIKEGRRVISIVLIQKDKQCTKKPNKPNMQCLSPLKAGVSQCVFLRSRCIQWLVMKVKVELSPEVPGSVKRGKWNSHKLFSPVKKDNS